MVDDLSGPAESQRTWLSRRDLVAAGTLIPIQLLSSSCAPIAAKPPAIGIGDAHVHLFNAADLAVTHFVQYVAIPARFPNAPNWGKAIIDLFATLLKELAPTAEREARSLRIGARLTGISPARFGFLVAQHIRQRTAPRPGALVDPEGSELIESYRELNRAISADSASPAGFLDPSQPNENLIAEIARKAEDGRIAPGDVADQKAASGFGTADLASAARLLGWGYLMLLPRARHLTRYCSRFRTAKYTPSIVLNLLVDYDFWLNDGPSPGSDVFAQVDVMSRIAALNRRNVDVRLFAGYCPLRHAIELRKGRPTTFDRLVALCREGKVHGFKIYPPMGFQPIGNEDLSDQNFDPKEKGRRTALDQWIAAGGERELGAALDGALHQFYRQCAAEGIPLMAHSARSNAAGPNYADRADHKFWAAVAGQYPIRLSLGHLVDNVEPFVRAVEKGPPYPTEIWSLASGTTLLDANSTGAEVYGDIGYTQELLDDPKLASRYFAAIQKAFGPRDPDLTRILYGTDWIMLGIERHNERYLECVARGMQDAKLTTSQQQNILSNNIRRFLRL